MKPVLARVAAFALIIAAVLAGAHFAAGPQEDERTVRETVNAFMRARLMRDATQARTFLTNDLHKQLTASADFSLVGTSNPHYDRFEIEHLSEQDDGSWQAHVIVTEEFAGYGEVGWFAEIVTLQPVGSGYRIAHIERGPYHNLPPE